MRLYDKSVIYWRSTPGSDLPNSVPWHMIPVRPRHLMQPQPGDVAAAYTGGGGRKRIDSKVWFQFSSPMKACYSGKATQLKVLSGFCVYRAAVDADVVQLGS